VKGQVGLSQKKKKKQRVKANPPMSYTARKGNEKKIIINTISRLQRNKRKEIEE
jgi:hypothetical protein